MPHFHKLLKQNYINLNKVKTNRAASSLYTYINSREYKHFSYIFGYVFKSDQNANYLPERQENFT